MAEWIEVCAEAELPHGSRKIIQTDAGEIVVFNLNGSLYAMEDRCSHDGGELASGELEADQIICPRHGARFCIKTGEALTPPAYEDLETFPVCKKEGKIFIDIT